jgi:hypothetical protein
MADNIVVTQGTGKTIAGDEVSLSGVTVTEQIVKIALGAKGAHDILVDSAQQTMANSLPVVLASDQSVISTTLLAAATNIAKAEDAAHSSGDTGAFVLGVRRDTPAALAGTEGDYSPFAVEATGAQRVVLDYRDQGNVANQLLKLEDAAAGSGDAGVAVLGVRNSTLTAKTGTDGDYGMLAIDSLGRLEVTTPATIVSVTPAISNAAIYAANDQLGGIQTIAAATTDSKFQTRLVNVTVIDKAKQSQPLTIFFFNANPTVASADNAALDITDAEMAAKYIGHVVVGTGDYAAISASSVACASCTLLLSAAASSVYAVAMTTGTPTYGSTSDLIFNYHMEKY